MDKFLQGLALIGFAVAAWFFQMFALIKLWGYIAVPLGAPVIDLSHAFGVSLIIGLFTPYNETKDSEAGTELAVKKIIHSFFSSLLAIGIGYWIFG